MDSWILSYIKQFKGRMSLSVLFGFLGVASGAMLLFVSGYLISKSSLRPENVMVVYVPIVSVRAFSIGQAVFPYLDKIVGHDVVLRILAEYRKRLYDNLEGDALAIQSKYQTGDLFHVLSEDIERLQDFYLKTLFPSVIGIVIYTIIIIVVGMFDVFFMLFLIALLGIIVFLIPYISYVKMKQKYTEQKEKRTTFYRHMTDAMFGQLDWLVSGRWKELEKNFLQEHHHLQATEKQIDRWHHIRDASGRFIGGVVIVVMMVWANKMVGEEALTPTLIAAFVLMTFSIIDALLPLSEAVEEVPMYVDTVNRIESFMQKNETETANKIDVNIMRPTIHLQDIAFRYEATSDKVMDGLNMTIAPGEKIALLGKSGAGKSTVLKLLAGLVEPNEGKVLLNDTPMDKGYLANAVAVLNQKPHLFHTSIANNIRIGRQDATEEEIIAVLEKVQLMDMIAKLPDGIHTNVDELGQRFSGGERQRIAFARVLIQETPIILLDEPTTGLDPKTERDLLKTFVEAAEEQTLILVTHHLIGAQWMNHIVFLEDGNIKMEGSHEQLLQTNNYYRTLYAMDELM